MQIIRNLPHRRHHHCESGNGGAAAESAEGARSCLGSTFPDFEIEKAPTLVGAAFLQLFCYRYIRSTAHR
jgi:hypothetical protein